MRRPASQGPDHALAHADVEAQGEAPEIYRVVDLRAYVKPEMDEEISDTAGTSSGPSRSMICTCVPVETCVCNTVTYPAGCTCVGHCSCVGNTCVSGLYWYPY